MKQDDLDTWEEFKRAISELRRENDAKRATSCRGISRPCFRGHASEKWKIETTLERAGHSEMNLLDYGSLMAKIAPEICTITNHRFNVPTLPDYENWLKKVETDGFMPQSPLGYDFMVYLRQHGFPSPLLDWTDSEYVAAYFAFADAPAADASNRVAIYAFVEYSEGGKISSALKPSIVGVGPFVLSHPRHFTQQARYTYCKKYDKAWMYSQHQRVFDADPASISDRQDVLHKFTLPVSERATVLTELSRFNLTAWTLFSTEESLMKTMAFKAL